MANDHEQLKPQVTSAPPARKQLSEEERKALYAKLRDRMRKSRLEILHPQLGRSYYWARSKDETELSRLDMLGFRVVKSDPKTPKPVANGLHEDGTYQLGDVILMDIDSEIYEYYLQDNIARADALIHSSQESFREEAERQGVPTFEVSQPGVRKGA